jgi:hypothetical protein
VPKVQVVVLVGQTNPAVVVDMVGTLRSDHCRNPMDTDRCLEVAA